MRKSVLLTAFAIAAAGAGWAKPYAVFHTSAGDFTAELFPDKAPKTVENFIALAKGTKDWQDPATGEVKKNKPLYDGTKFHRTIPGFMVQGGDPMGTGRGGPGYKFEDEFSDLGFDKVGRLAMANSGPNTNGSQFFVTVGLTPHLNNRHTIFGQIVSGQDVVTKISEMPSQPGSGIAVNPVTLISVKIVDDLAQASGGKKDGGEKEKSGTAGSPEAKTTGSAAAAKDKSETKK